MGWKESWAWSPEAEGPLEKSREDQAFELWPPLSMAQGTS